MLEEDQVEVLSPSDQVGLHLFLSFFVFAGHADLLADLIVKLAELF